MGKSDKNKVYINYCLVDDDAYDVNLVNNGEIGEYMVNKKPR